MNKTGKIILIIVSALLALVFVALCGFSAYMAYTYRDFYKNSSKGFKIPGLGLDGCVPQGFEYLPEIDTFLYTGYHKDGESPSMIFVMPQGGKGEARKIELYKADGTAFNGHVGGITVYGEYVYIADGYSVALFDIYDILDSDGEATQISSFDNDFQVAFVEVHNGDLYVGNFYRAGDYETPKSHHITTPNGDQNTAMIYVYSLRESTGLPFSAYPWAVFSITDAIQGMAFGDNGEVFLSSSWGLSTSKIYVYNLNQMTTEPHRLENGKQLSIHYLDSGCLIETIEAPPMAEEIVYIDGNLYIMNESASMKYLFGKLMNGHWCYAYEYDPYNPY